MKVLITGAAGFIGSALALSLLEDGHEVVGIDNMNDYYEISLKRARLARTLSHEKFSFHEISIADKDKMFALEEELQDVTHIMNLAAQAGVRYSLENPFAYVESNVMGYVILLELARKLPKLEHFVFASSSSVYGGNKKVPFSVEDPVEHPISVYAATKRSDELLAHTYAHLYNIPCTGLRFFTVYGPWGRPDMAAYKFAKKIWKGESIPVFNNGNLTRDFTYIDDIIDGVRGVLTCPFPESKNPPARLYNLGNAQVETLMDYITALEKGLGKKAICDFLPMQAGDVLQTSADISESTKDFGYNPQTSIQDGLQAFGDWFKEYHKDGIIE